MVGGGGGVVEVGVLQCSVYVRKYTVKKGYRFPFPSRDDTNQTVLGRE
jgi:hypothetical protein